MYFCNYNFYVVVSKRFFKTLIYIYIYIYIYIIRELVVTKSLCGYVSNQVQ